MDTKQLCELGLNLPSPWYVKEVSIEKDAQEYNMEATICQGLSYVFHDIEASASGTYETTVQTDGACDSTFIILLTVETPMAIVSTETICQGKTFEWNG